MENERVVEDSRRKRRKLVLLILVAVLVFAIVIAIVLGVVASAKSSSFKNVVMERCQTYLSKNSHMARENDCKTIWTAFEQAYIGKDPCDVPPEAYSSLIKSVKQDAACNTMLFWSKTKDIVQAFTDNRECLVVLEDTLLGVMFDALTWCSKNKSKDMIHDPDYFSVSSIIERVNKNAGKMKRDFIITHGDIAMPTGLQNADPCTSRRCKWPSNNGNVIVPYSISRQYAFAERQVIERALNSFQNSTCVRFVPRTNQEDFINIVSDNGCFSSVGRRGGRQILSIQRDGCVFHHIIQHELLHALGFHHEQTRSDRDDHVRILLQNVIPGQEHNFDIVNTNNLNTPYDYDSVMHYSRFAFSSNRQPTIIPIPDNNVPIGRATEMSRNDILRVNRLYCG
ncbi:High choriolytic enzyme 1 [Bagarius yarrelli]|uniref:Metalloendopeptidase n=1 Tax=Bagarius yarrelli TaxID=175774 RepID=A0A556V064_BAGYA|nr:High choriolytic enzyme 1 [Bagarius yarrelli]